MRLDIDWGAVERLPPDQRAEFERELAEVDRLLEEDPLQGFEPHSAPQEELLAATTPVQAAFCGNQFGKTCAVTVKALIQHVPSGGLPERLRAYKLTPDGRAVDGYLCCPSFKALDTFLLPELRKWAPRRYLLGGSFDKAWDKANRVLRWADGGKQHVFTYEQDADKFVGARLDYVAFDEPPPERIRNEAMMRLVARGGFELYAMTPINMQGGGIGWIYREIWKRREDPDYTVVNGSIHDNPLLDKATVARTLERYSEEERRTREFGEFTHIGGMVYPGGFEQHLTKRAITPEDVRGWDVVVGLDPGLKNAAFVWVGFDSDQRAVVFHEALVQEGTPADYVRAIGEGNSRWGVTDPLYCIDPSARNRSLTNAESVEGELARLGIYCAHGQNAVEAGVQQVRRRLQHGMLLVSPDCRGLRDEAEEYRAEDRPDGEFKVVKENDHRLDALRYAVMQRPWGPEMQERAEELLGWEPGKALSARQLAGVGRRASAGPLGSFG